MASPVYLDGPLHGQHHEVPEDVIEQGIYRTESGVVYTFTLVEVFGFRLPVASTANGIPNHQLLFDNLASDRAKQAAGRA